MLLLGIGLRLIAVIRFEQAAFTSVSEYGHPAANQTRPVSTHVLPLMESSSQQ